MENALKYAIVLLSFLTFGCGLTDPEPDLPQAVEGEWNGLVYDNEGFTSFFHVGIKDGVVLGSYKTVFVNTAFAPFYGSLIGDEDSFVMQIQIGSEWNAEWTYFGYVKDEELCISRDLLPLPIRCLSPVSNINP